MGECRWSDPRLRETDKKSKENEGNTHNEIVCVRVCVCDICICGSEAAPVMDGPHLYVHTE